MCCGHVGSNDGVRLMIIAIQVGANHSIAFEVNKHEQPHTSYGFKESCFQTHANLCRNRE
jgi:hypothetical protein